MMRSPDSNRETIEDCLYDLEKLRFSTHARINEIELEFVNEINKKISWALLKTPLRIYNNENKNTRE